jgi:hypothetical protein
MGISNCRNVESVEENVKISLMGSEKIFEDFNQNSESTEHNPHKICGIKWYLLQGNWEKEMYFSKYKPNEEIYSEYFFNFTDSKIIQEFHVPKELEKPIKYLKIVEGSYEFSNSKKIIDVFITKASIIEKDRELDFFGEYHMNVWSVTNDSLYLKNINICL